MEAHLLGVKFQLTIRRYSVQKGICSDLGGGRHFLMWDFDDQEQETILESLKAAQDRFQLPTIYVLQSSAKGGVHAYCFQDLSWIDSVYVVGSTTAVDPGFWKLGVLRGFWTLRYSRKRADDFRAICQLPSSVPESVSWEDARHMVHFRTMHP